MSRGRDLRLKYPQFREMYLNVRITYTKPGQKFGWRGTAVDVYQKKGTHILVRYDNGVTQSYRMDALHQMQKSWGAWDAYLVMDKVHHEQRLKWLSKKNPTFSNGRPLYPFDIKNMIAISKEAIANNPY